VSAWRPDLLARLLLWTLFLRYRLRPCPECKAGRLRRCRSRYKGAAMRPLPAPHAGRMAART
jgi:hypothetical protein